MRIARIARPGAIYDASTAAQTFPECEIIEENVECGEIFKIEEEEGLTKSKENDFEHMPGFTKILHGEQMDVNKVNLFGGIRKLIRPKPILR